MGKETTTTFTVTVTYTGPQKDFDKLFKARGRVSTFNSVAGQSNTKMTAADNIYTDEQKMVRLFIKQACEAAGLDYAGVKLSVGSPKTYNLDYHYKTSKRSKKAAYYIYLCGVKIELDFDSGIDSQGKLRLFDHHNEIVKKMKTQYGWEAETTIPNYEADFSVADPKCKDDLIKILKEWGYKHDKHYPDRTPKPTASWPYTL